MTVHPVENFDDEYVEFQERQQIPVHRGMVIEDVREIETGPWELTGGDGAFVNLKGMEMICDIHIHDIPPGGQLNTLRHLHDSLNLVISGSGLTRLGEEAEATFEWDDGALFYLPRNTEYQHVNVQGDEKVRLLSLTSLPILYTLHKDHEIIWENDVRSEWSEITEDIYHPGITEVQHGEGRGNDSRAYWEANFIPSIQGFKELESWPERGGGGKNVNFPFRRSSMYAHISEFQQGKYKKAHRHHPGANIVVITGEGYSYMWREGDEERTRVDWKPYTLFTPPTLWFHQHFNTSETAARYIALHAPQFGMRAVDDSALDSQHRGNQIEYPDEDPEVREEFERELAAKGLESDMDPELFER